MRFYHCPEHGAQTFEVLNWNSRGTTYHDGSFDFTAVFELTCGCQVREETYANNDVVCYRTEQRDDVPVSDNA